MIAIVALLAFLSGETNTGGQFKQCHYNYNGEVYTITVPSYKLCPLSIDVKL